MAIVQTMAKWDLRPFCTHDFDSAVFQLMSQDTSRSVRTSHASGSRSIQTEILNFSVNHILQVSCDWILCCDWYALHGAGRQVALWPNPRPCPSVRNRVWPRETTVLYSTEPEGHSHCLFLIMKVKVLLWIFTVSQQLQFPKLCITLMIRDK